MRPGPPDERRLYEPSLRPFLRRSPTRLVDRDSRRRWRRLHAERLRLPGPPVVSSLRSPYQSLAVGALVDAFLLVVSAPLAADRRRPRDPPFRDGGESSRRALTSLRGRGVWGSPPTRLHAPRPWPGPSERSGRRPRAGRRPVPRSRGTADVDPAVRGRHPRDRHVRDPR